MGSEVKGEGEEFTRILGPVPLGLGLELEPLIPPLGLFVPEPEMAPKRPENPDLGVDGPDVETEVNEADVDAEIDTDGTLSYDVEFELVTGIPVSR